MDGNKEMIPPARELTPNTPQENATTSYTLIFRPSSYNLCKNSTPLAMFIPQKGRKHYILTLDHGRHESSVTYTLPNATHLREDPGETLSASDMTNGHGYLLPA